MVSPPTSGVFRVGRNDRAAFSIPDWEDAGSHRFDDPLHGHQFDQSKNYNVIYSSSSLEGSYVETMQGLRVSLATVAAVESTTPLPMTTGGRVTNRWRSRRSWARATISSSGQFIDVSSAETIAFLRSQSQFAALAMSLGLQDVDVSTLTGPHRSFTQSVSRYFFELLPDCVGVRYVSRFGTDQEYECWALFENRVEINVIEAGSPCGLRDGAFRRAAELLNLAIDI